MTGLFAAVGLLTRLPVPSRAHDGWASSASWFPVVGGAVGLAVAGVYASAFLVLPPAVAGAIAVAVGIVLTGALHEDGLADIADAAGGATVEDRRRILDDPVHGTYGMLALALSVVLRTVAVAALPPGAATGALLAAHALGRTAAVALMATGPTAADGLGAGYAGRLRRRHVAVAMAAGAVLTAAGLQLWAGAAVALAAVAVLSVRRWARRRLGRISGDVLGACEQLTEIAVLLLAAAILRQ